MVEFKMDVPNINKIRKQMKKMPEGAEIAIQRAINKTIAYIKTYIAKEAVEARYKVKASAVKKTLTTKNASRRKLHGYVQSTSKNLIPLKGFQVSPGTNKRVPVLYKSKVMKDGKLIGLTGNGERSKGFIAKMPSKHVGVFQRVDKDSNKITELKGPSISSMIKSVSTSIMIKNESQIYLHNRIQHEINYLLGGAKWHLYFCKSAYVIN